MGLNRKLKKLNKAVRGGSMTFGEYVDKISKLCDQHGTEYVATRMMELGLH